MKQEGRGQGTTSERTTQPRAQHKRDQMGPRTRTSQLDEILMLSTSSSLQAKRHTQRRHDSFKANHQRPKSARWPDPWKTLPLPHNSWNNPLPH